MVILVTTVVVRYRETYMEHYNNKKFLVILGRFLAAILVLVAGERIINIMTGWEILGLTSLALIIFYPHKTGKVNSIITIFFNRVGDICLIMILAEIMANQRNTTRSPLIREENWALIIICALTKRAQFPISAWLPAAIAAPTPISAIVHSSTLVTAGIFLVLKFKDFLTIREWSIAVISRVRIISFIMGGLIGCLEKDFKKIIAFSTIRQIRIVIHFASTTEGRLALTHIVYHAIFKTLLFCMAGLIFLKAWGAQNRIELGARTREKVRAAMVVIRIFSMTGLLFSASFFTKDLYLEIEIVTTKCGIKTLFLIGARFLTMVYRIKIINPLKNRIILPGLDLKWRNSLALVTISLISLRLPLLEKKTIAKEIIPIIIKEEVWAVIVILIITPLLIKISMVDNKWVENITGDVGHIKFAMYRITSKLSGEALKAAEREALILKKSFISLKGKNIRICRAYFRLACLSLLLILYSISLRNVALKMLKNKNKNIP